MVVTWSCSMTAPRWCCTRTASTLSTYDERTVNRSDLLSSCPTTIHSRTILLRSRRRSFLCNTLRAISMARSLSLLNKLKHQLKIIGRSLSRSGKEPRRLSSSDLVTRSYRSYSKTRQSSSSAQDLALSSSSPHDVRLEQHLSIVTLRPRIPASTSD